MKGANVQLMILSGLCCLPSCFLCLYILVRKPMNWSEALSYCRREYTDLASVQSEQDSADLNELTGRKLRVWIGLQVDTEAWKWSLENPGFYGEGEAAFRKWAVGEPDGSATFYKFCAAMRDTGDWVDTDCTEILPYICYNGKNTSPSFIVITKSKSWDEAQSYCRTHYTDLASVRNQAENGQIRKMLIKSEFAWVGLYRDSWKWSDGSTLSFTNWNTSTPSIKYSHSCVNSYLGKWKNQGCNSGRNFVCYIPTIRKQVVQVVLKKTGSSVNMEALKEDILERINQRLKDHVPSEGLKLRWVKQAEGKIFHKEEEEEEQENRCAAN